MRFRTLGETELNVSEIGFGVWTVSTGWWGKIDERDGVGLLRRAADLGVNFFDTADTYGLGYGEEIVAKALKGCRHDIIVATKFGYDFYTSVEREGHAERPQNFDPEFVHHACEESLRRLDTDYIDLYQLHNPRMDAIERDDLFATLDELVEQGKVRHYGAALGPDIGWFEEGEASMRVRAVPALQIIYSILEQDPARRFFPIASDEGTGLITRVPHASGLLDGTYTKDTVFDPSDHRSHRRQQWLERGLQKLAKLEFLTDELGSTLGQIAIKFALAGPQVATVLPNFTSQAQLEEFAAAPETEDVPAEFLTQVAELYDGDFELAPVEEPVASSPEPD